MEPKVDIWLESKERFDIEKKITFYLFISNDNQLHSPKHHDSIFGEKK